MIKKFLVALVLMASSLLLSAQDISLALQKTPKMPVQVKATQWAKLYNKVYVSFTNSNRRYNQGIVPDIQLQSQLQLTGWRGEKLNAQILVWAGIDINPVSVAVEDLVSKKGQRIAASQLSAGFVGYVMTDEFKNGCGYRKPQNFDSSLVADPIFTEKKQTKLNKNTVQPMWVSIAIPANIPPGEYTGNIMVKAGKKFPLRFTVKVLNKTLPPSSLWKFNLDFWQHPAAIARVHQVKLWSDEHFALMKKYYAMLAAAGQKNITASIVNEPWGHQTYDDYPSLVKWIKKKDGSWLYDYSLFDKYISFVMDCGITNRINCYSMVPWKIAFQYFDESSGKDTLFTNAIGSAAYNEFWKTMLTDFTRHLKTKNWFHKTAIAMDERPMDAMQSVIKLLKEVDKDWKIALAGEYHPEIEKDIYDYCIASKWQFPSDTLQLRQQQGKLSTWYTCCVEKYPNGFTFSPPAEHVWIGWYTAAKNMDGYLRWAYNSWPKNPVQDSRFTAWPAGDTYQVYPGPATSIRFEKLIEGIQDYEKISILKKEYIKTGNQIKLKELNDLLVQFEINALKKTTAEEMLLKAKKILYKDF